MDSFCTFLVTKTMLAKGKILVGINSLKCFVLGSVFHFLSNYRSTVSCDSLS